MKKIKVRVFVNEDEFDECEFYMSVDDDNQHSLAKEVARYYFDNFDGWERWQANEEKHFNIYNNQAVIYKGFIKLEYEPIFLV